MLGAWNSFYVMIGSSAAALTGLMFVVITLMRESDRGESAEDGVSTFNTPTVVHFCCALFTSALLAAPFESLVPIAIILGLAGVAGMTYVVRIARRTAKLRSYQADAEDWTWHAFLPFVAYATIAFGAIAMPFAAGPALFAPAAAVLLLIFVGIHNAWDVVTFLATGKAAALSGEPANSDGREKKS